MRSKLDDTIDDKSSAKYSTLAEKFIGALQAPQETDENLKRAAEIGLNLA